MILQSPNHMTLHDFLQSLSLSPTTYDMLHYNLSDGKLLRLNIFRQTLSNLKIILNYDSLGWCIELLQAFFLITDDIIDSSTLRRNKPAWYILNGLSSLEDALTIHTLLYAHIFTYRSHTNFYEILNLFTDVETITWLGQCQDNLQRDPKDYNFVFYKDQVRSKTTYYTFILPVKLAFLVANQVYRDEYSSILEDVGFMFQFKDDYLNFYPKMSMKSGTDLEEKKVTWFICKLMEDGREDVVMRYLEGNESREIRCCIDEYLRGYEGIVEEMRESVEKRCGDEKFIMDVVDQVVGRRK